MENQDTFCKRAERRLRCITQTSLFTMAFIVYILYVYRTWGLPTYNIAPLRKIPVQKVSTIIINNETITFDGKVQKKSVLYIRRLATAQGIHFRTDNIKVWNTTGISFASLPYSKKPQPWFTKAHNHNKNAIYSKWYQGMPGYSMFSKLPYVSKYLTVPTGENLLVNRKNTIQKEVGIEWVMINATGNKAGRFKITAVNKYGMLNQQWIIFLLSFFLITSMVAQYTYKCAVYGCYDVTIGSLMVKQEGCAGCWKNFKGLLFAFYGVAYGLFKQLKNFTYLLNYPHTSWYSALWLWLISLLSLSIEFEPINYNLIKWFTIMYKQGIESKVLQVNKSTGGYGLLNLLVNITIILVMLIDTLAFGRQLNLFQQLSIFQSGITLLRSIATYSADGKTKSLIWPKNNNTSKDNLEKESLENFLDKTEQAKLKLDKQTERFRKNLGTEINDVGRSDIVGTLISIVFLWILHYVWEYLRIFPNNTQSVIKNFDLIEKSNGYLYLLNIVIIILIYLYLRSKRNTATDHYSKCRKKLDEEGRKRFIENIKEGKDKEGKERKGKGLLTIFKEAKETIKSNKDLLTDFTSHQDHEHDKEKDSKLSQLYTALFIIEKILLQKYFMLNNVMEIHEKEDNGVEISQEQKDYAHDECKFAIIEIQVRIYLFSGEIVHMTKDDSDMESSDEDQKDPKEEPLLNKDNQEFPL